MSLLSVAREHYRVRARMARALEREAARLWRQVDRANISGSWADLLPRLLVAVVAAQRASAAASDAYVAAALAEQDASTGQVGVNAAAFAGIASDGRNLGTLLAQPIITSKVALERGTTEAYALAAGQAALQMIVATQVADAGRVADGVALTAQRRATGYVRMTVGRTCSRCLILAGKRYEWNQGFQRHPRCDCRHIPVAEDVPLSVQTSPKAAFDAMDRAEQDRVFTKAGAQAIREGADMGQVVNARKGMYTAAGRTLTAEGATRRGFAGARLGAPRGQRAIRLMPEQIYREARGNRDEALRLLRLHGYIL
ncbi:hypothetical protein ABGB07_02280 [Micromonosporaceae bacterium B7E4]